jgi:hypothetical protein
MPLPAVWGPLAWSLLHAIGEKAGRCSTQKLKLDENREAIWLITHLEYIIPCSECRIHIRQYRKQHGLPRSSGEIGLWLWTFHEAVNQRLGKPPGPSGPESVKGNVAGVWKQYMECVKESFQVGHLHQTEVKEWNRHLRHWLACF